MRIPLFQSLLKFQYHYLRSWISTLKPLYKMHRLQDFVKPPENQHIPPWDKENHRLKNAGDGTVPRRLLY